MHTMALGLHPALIAQMRVLERRSEQEQEESVSRLLGEMGEQDLYALLSQEISPERGAFEALVLCIKTAIKTHTFCEGGYCLVKLYGPSSGSGTSFFRAPLESAPFTITVAGARALSAAISEDPAINALIIQSKEGSFNDAVASAFAQALPKRRFKVLTLIGSYGEPGLRALQRALPSLLDPTENSTRSHGFCASQTEHFELSVPIRCRDRCFLL